MTAELYREPGNEPPRRGRAEYQRHPGLVDRGAQIIQPVLIGVEPESDLGEQGARLVTVQVPLAEDDQPRAFSRSFVKGVAHPSEVATDGSGRVLFVYVAVRLADRYLKVFDGVPQFAEPGRGYHSAAGPAPLGFTTHVGR